MSSQNGTANEAIHGCGSVGRVVASNKEDPGSNPAIIIFNNEHLYTVNCFKDQNKEKEAVNGHSKTNEETVVVQLYHPTPEDHDLNLV